MRINIEAGGRWKRQAVDKFVVRRHERLHLERRRFNTLQLLKGTEVQGTQGLK